MISRKPPRRNRSEHPLKALLDDARDAGPQALCKEIGSFIDCQKANFDEALERCTFDGLEAIGYAVGRRSLNRIESEVNKICRGEFGDLDESFNCLADFGLLINIERKCEVERLITNKKPRFEAEVECIKNVINDADNCGPEAEDFVENFLNYVYDIYEAIKDNKSTGTPSLTGLDWMF